MNSKTILPGGPLNARVVVPGSKSITNRALICASLADGGSVIENASDSTDSGLLANGLNQLGVLVRRHASSFTVDGTGGRLTAPKFPIPVGNAGTTLRFLVSVSALARGTTVFEGSARMGERPIDDLLEALQVLGARARRMPGGTRYEVEGGTLHGGAVSISGDKSSQFLSSLLMVAPYVETGVSLEVEGKLISASYVTMTFEVMRAFGLDVPAGSMERRWTVQRGRYRPCRFRVDADASSATYPLAAAAVAGGEVLVENLTLKSGQGDARFALVLQSMGCQVAEEDGGVRLRCLKPLSGVEIDMGSMPDAVPALAVAALFARGETRIRNVAHLRYKESDRLEALATELRKLGAKVVVNDDGLAISPAPLHGARLSTYNDHRLAMSFAVVGLKVPGVEVENPDCVAKSYPEFWKEFEKMRNAT